MRRHSDSIHQVHLYAAYGLSLSAGVFLMTVLVGVSLLNPGSYPDPFVPYEAIMPGQTLGKLDAFGCYRHDPPTSIGGLICPIKRPEQSVFNRVHTITNNGVVQQVTFYGETLQVVDLIRHFGKPETIEVKEQSYFLSWGDTIYARVPIAARRYHHQLRVLFVTVKLLPDVNRGTVQNSGFSVKAFVEKGSEVNSQLRNFTGTDLSLCKPLEFLLTSTTVS
jgi:hypothetical protein